MTANEKLPALRPIEILPVSGKNDQVYFHLRDPAGLSPHQIAVPPAGYFVIAHLDGEHTCADIQAIFRKHTGLELPEAEITKLVAALDEALLLRGARVEQAFAARAAAYRAAPTRSNLDRFPDGQGLRNEIESLLARGVAAPVGEVRGLIAPHLDYERGGPCYADAYATLARAAPAERFVILGTNHFGQSLTVVATTKDFETPLGRAVTDRAFIAALERRLGQPLCEHEEDHQQEHSIELQVHCLQVLMAGRPFSIVPVLCPDVCGPTGTAPPDGRGPDLRDVAGALRDLLATADRPTTVVAGADLSHVGVWFGDPEPLDTPDLEAVAASDRKLLALLEAREEARFVETLAASHNPTRICSAGCIYTLLAALPGRPCRVLSYHQAVNRRAQNHVTCAAAVVC